MGKTQRDGYIFLSWKGDHLVRHVQSSGKELVVKWDLENKAVMKGQITRRSRSLMDQLEVEGCEDPFGCAQQSEESV